jgi:hypothetical protein
MVLIISGYCVERNGELVLGPVAQCGLVGSPSFENAEAARGGLYLWLCGALVMYATVLLLYSQTWAFVWDESYHMLAAQLMSRGRKPYIDFCFPQSPLNAYWNMGLMRVFGEGWRVPHAFAALFTIGAMALTADYVFIRLPFPSWRFGAALTAGLAVGLNPLVFIYGPVGQAYGVCLFTLVAAFRICVRAVDRSGVIRPMSAGLLAGVAASSSLLTAVAGPVMLVWLLFYNRSGSRSTKLVAFGIGAAIPFAPVFALFLQGPRQTWFNLFRYHASFRKLYWPETTKHDFEVLTSWLDSGQGLVLGLLAVFGLVYVARRSNWPRALKAEFYLCAWLASALSVEVGRAHPTFERYFLLVVPFLAILAVVGLYAVGSRVLEPGRPLWPVALVLMVVVLGWGKALSERDGANNWSFYQRLADKADQVTPRDALLYANEPIYFLTRRTPPPGLELSYTHKIVLPPAEAAMLHILNDADLKKQLESGMYATAYSCDDDEVDNFGLKKLYQQRVSIDECTVFWDWKKVAGRK